MSNTPWKSLKRLEGTSGQAHILITDRGEVFEGWRNGDGTYTGKYHTPPDPVVAWTDNFPDPPIRLFEGEHELWPEECNYEKDTRP